MANKIEFKILGDAKDLENSLKQSGQSIRSFGTQLTVFGAAATGAIALISKQAGNLEQGITNTLTLIGGSSDNMRKQLTDDVKQIAEQYGISKDQLTASLFDIVSATGDAANSTKLLEQASRLAVSGNSSLVESTSGLLTLMESYGDQLKGTADASDLLFKAQEKSRATVGELAAASGTFLPIARQLNVNVDELFGTFAQLTVALGNSSEAATSLQGILNGFIKPTEELTRLTKEWGFESSQAALQQLGLLGVLKKLNTVEGERLGKLFPRIEGLKGLGAALQNIGRVEQNVADIRNRSGAVNDALAKQEENFNLQLAQVQESIHNIVLEIGENFLPVLKDLFDEVKPVVTQISDWVKENPELVKSIIVLVAKVGALSLVLGPVLTIFGQMVIITGNLVPATAALAGNIGLIGTALTTVSGVGVAAFAGWKLGRLIGEVTGLDEDLSGPDGLFTRLVERARELKEELREAVSLAFDSGAAGGGQPQSISGEGEFVIAGDEGFGDEVSKEQQKQDQLVSIKQEADEKIKKSEEEKKEALAFFRDQDTESLTKNFAIQASLLTSHGKRIKAVEIVTGLVQQQGALLKAWNSATFPFNLPAVAFTLAQTGALLSIMRSASFEQGTPSVPRDMVANIHRGETIIPEDFASSIRSGELALVGRGGSQSEGRSIIFDFSGANLNGVTEQFVEDIFTKASENITNKTLAPLPV